MANAWYQQGLSTIAQGGVNWVGDTIKAVLVDTAAYTVDLNAHANLSDIPSGARIATTAALTGKAVFSGGHCDAADVSLTGVTGPTVEAVVVYKDTGVAATSTLLVYIDTATGLPTAALSSSNVTITWDNGTNKILTV